MPLTVDSALVRWHDRSPARGKGEEYNPEAWKQYVKG